MVAEGGRHVVVNAEPMRYVDLEPFSQVLLYFGRATEQSGNSGGVDEKTATSGRRRGDDISTDPQNRHKIEREEMTRDN